MVRNRPPRPYARAPVAAPSRRAAEAPCPRARADAFAPLRAARRGNAPHPAASAAGGPAVAARRAAAPRPLAGGAAVAAVAALTLPAAALAGPHTGRDAPVPPSAAAPPVHPPSVAAAAAGRPEVEAVTCRTACLGLATATPGSVVRVSGAAAGAATSIVFLGRRGPEDDVAAPARPAGRGAAEVVLPFRARSGRVRLVCAGHRSRRSRGVLSVRPARAVATGRRVQARVEAHRVEADTARPATLDVYVGGGGSFDVDVDVIRRAEGAVVGHRTLVAVGGGTVHTFEWARGAAQPDGRYGFRATVVEAVLDAAWEARAPAPAIVGPPVDGAGFVIARSRFPVAGPHRYGEGFGAARSGHSHQGQDVFATCGTPLVAAQAGVVRFVGYEGAAGHYLVIRSSDTGQDQVYMHLRDRARVREHETVAAGTPLGFVGATGDAQGCHLHFELWHAPGWYAGGKPFDPLPTLRAWEAEAA
jgi:Peptidase family M23